MNFFGIQIDSFWSYYLIFCSFLAFALFLERILFFLTLSRLPKMECQHIQKALSQGYYPDECPRIRSSALKEALSLIFTHQSQQKDLKQEVFNAWFDTHKKEVYQRLKWLNLVALAAFLGGVLGSVLGFIQSITVLTSVSPHDFMKILKQSLYYLAFGMMISFPVFIFSKALKIWGGFYLSSIQKSLKMLLLSLENYPIAPLPLCPYSEKNVVKNEHS